MGSDGKIKQYARVVKVRKNGVEIILTTEPLDYVVVVGKLEVNITNRVVMKEGRIVGLTRKEFDVLEVLVLEAGTAVTREDIMHKARLKESESNLVDVYINSIRKKIDKVEEGLGVRLVRTIKNLGYVIKETRE